MESIDNTLIKSKYRILCEGDSMFNFLEPNFCCGVFCSPLTGGGGDGGDGGGGGNGGGCFTDDLVLITPNGLRKFRELKVGDLILTPDGYKPIEEIYYKGVQRIYIYKGLKLSPTQPIVLSNGNLQSLALAKDVGVETSIYEHTWDLKVEGALFYALGENDEKIILVDYPKKETII
ncbi:hypothetical protein DDW13_03470 [Acidianus hospitalis]|uniref:Hedgehog/Intein (Hint) domain-containing protein n=1 Tax=Acidianus hospitalis TaxID=563177 RepID=A0A2T9X8G3_9CREN|nr:hypothetical protein DDW13_03470 [Acidianus hospitalis]